MRVNRASHVPRFEQVKQIVRQFILDNNLRPGDLLPSEREWAQRLQVSQMTVNRALKELEQEGILSRLVGKGTFVLRPPVMIPPRQSLVLVFPFAETAALTAENIYYGPILQGILSALADVGWMVQFWKMGFDQLRHFPPETLAQRALLIFAPFEDALPVLAEWWQAGVPFVVIGASWKEASLPCVDSDNFSAAQKVVDFLVELGHRRIALLTGPRNAPNTRDRWEGFLAGVKKHRLTVLPEWLIESEHSTLISAKAQEQLRAVLHQPSRPTAWFVAGYYLAAHVLRLLKTEGWRVPEDFSLVAFDDPPSATFLEPPLTTMRQPLVELGRRAVFKLLSVLEGEVEPAVEKLPVELVVRASTTSPAKS